MNPAPTNGELPPNFRKFRFRASLENTETGAPIASEGELVATSSAFGLVKLIAAFSDSPLRILALEFKDVSEQRVVVLTPGR